MGAGADTSSGDGAACDVFVIGAGIVGVSCALYLQTAGFSVAVLDRGPPGKGASEGNAGSIGIASTPPNAMPGVIRRAPAMLIDPMAPLAIDWRRLPWLAPWLWRFARSSAPRQVHRIAAARHALLERALDAYAQLLAAASVEHLLRSVGKLFVYENANAFSNAGLSMEIRRRYGARMEILSGDAARAIEPAIGARIERALYFPDHHSIASPLALVEGLAAHFIARGGVIICDEARGFDVNGAGVSGVEGLRARYRCGRVVIAAGAWSRRLARMLGTVLPIEAERGYNVTIARPDVEFRMPVTLAERHIAIVPMLDGLRISGVAEFSSADAPPNWKRTDVLMSNLRAAMPHLRGSPVSRWMGPRPSLPDSLPAIGRSPRYPNVFYACGHDHLGLTMGPITGRIVADLISGRSPEIDLAPYAPDRFH